MGRSDMDEMDVQSIDFGHELAEGIGCAGMWHGFYDLPPERRWAIVQCVADNAIPPPRVKE